MKTKHISMRIRAAALIVSMFAVIGLVAASSASAEGTQGHESSPTGFVAAWHAVRSPGFGPNLYISGLAAISANDVCAGGHYTAPQPTIVTLHWNGSTWTSVPN